MSIEAYQAANKLAQKAYRTAMNKGDYPYLSALDDFLPYERTAGEKYIGVIEIPLYLVAGTKTAGRQNSFANNFMPLLDVETEFAYKWSGLYDSQLAEGIRDPIVAYEYMHRFYVMEGNKRVSVLKSLNAVKIKYILNLWIFMTTRKSMISGFQRKVPMQSCIKIMAISRARRGLKKAGQRCAASF